MFIAQTSSRCWTTQCFLLNVIWLRIFITSVAALTQLSDASLKGLREVKDEFDIDTGSLLSPILIPRVPGTPGSVTVREHFINFFHDHLPSWSINLHNFTAQVPPNQEEVPFVNIIATRDPPGSKAGEVAYLTLVAHYDSLKDPAGFIGAIDSAAPCAMLMHLAQSLEPALRRKWDARDSAKRDDFYELERYDENASEEEQQHGLQIIFLDGEEAFVKWTAEDSIYGAKALAQHMEQTIHPALSTYRSAIDSISLFVLLDLLGTASPSVPSYFPTTHWAYNRLADLGKRLHAVSKTSQDTTAWFPDTEKKEKMWLGGQIGDDHTPFQERGVEILHLIPLPFPDEIWHTMNDDGEHLDIPTCMDWTMLVTAFVAEWLDLEGHMLSGPGEKVVTRNAEEEQGKSAAVLENPLHSEPRSKTEL